MTFQAWKWKWICSVVSDSLRPVDCSPPGSSVHGILQARILEWVAISFSRGSSWPRDWTRSPALQADTLTSEPPGSPKCNTSQSQFLRREDYNVPNHSILYIYALWEKTGWTFITSSVQFSHSVRSDPLRPHGLHHGRPPCPWPTPGDYSNSWPLSQWWHPVISCSVSNSWPLSQWWHPIISSSVILFSSCLQSFPASGFFQWVSSLHEVAKVLEFQLQHQSFQWTLRTDLL